jgi:hypothetical protein
MTTGFDRIRSRTTGGDPDVVAGDMPTDRDGRQALWSDVVEPPSFGSITVECSTCGQTSVLGLRAAARAAVPSVHLPFVRGRYGSYMSCPACHDRTWVRVGLRL